MGGGNERDRTLEYRCKRNLVLDSRIKWTVGRCVEFGSLPRSDPAARRRIVIVDEDTQDTHRVGRGGICGKSESSWERQCYVCVRRLTGCLRHHDLCCSRDGIPPEAVVPLSVVDRILVISNLGALPSWIHPPSEL
jgi:hypothetical protein